MIIAVTSGLTVIRCCSAKMGRGTKMKRRKDRRWLDRECGEGRDGGEVEGKMGKGKREERRASISKACRPALGVRLPTR